MRDRKVVRYVVSKLGDDVIGWVTDEGRRVFFAAPDTTDLAPKWVTKITSATKFKTVLQAFVVAIINDATVLRYNATQRTWSRLSDEELEAAKESG